MGQTGLIAPSKAPQIGWLRRSALDRPALDRSEAMPGALPDEGTQRGALRCAVLALVAVLATMAAAQPPPGTIEGQLLQRQQYQNELLLRQRQFQQLADPALTPTQRLELERRHFDQAQRQRQLHDSQLRRHLPLQQELLQLPPTRQQEQLTYEKWRFERERESEWPSLEIDP